MTAGELLTLARRNGVIFEARGDTLHVEAPAGVLTPELRADLQRHKPALLTLLTTEYVHFKSGLIVPLPALRVALDLENRGFRMSVDERRQFQIEPAGALSEADLTAIRRWHWHLGAILADSDAGADREHVSGTSARPDGIDPRGST